MSIGITGFAVGQILGQAQRGSAYRDLKKIVDQLPTTKQNEAKWAEVRPDPPRHMNLALEPRPRHFGRLCRFRVGDDVRVIHETSTRRVVTVECPEVNLFGWSHCSGNDAIYTLDDGLRVGDIDLTFAHTLEVELQLPSGRRVRVVIHNGRLLSLVDGISWTPLGAEDVEMGDWEFLFFNFLPKAAITFAHA